MQIDGIETLNLGEQRPIYVQVEAGEGNTLQVLATTDTPAAAANPTYRLLDSAGTVVTAATAVTGYDAGPVSAPRVWVNLATASLTAGATYTLEFTFEAVAGSGVNEGFTRKYIRGVQVWVS
jgi:hypothetical protein